LALVVAAPQFRDELQNLLEHLPWDGDLSHLEDDVAAVANNPRAVLISFSFKLASDQPLIGSGVASRDNAPGHLNPYLVAPAAWRCSQRAVRCPSLRSKRR
jgi:hypothetical protein